MSEAVTLSNHLDDLCRSLSFGLAEFIKDRILCPSFLFLYTSKKFHQVLHSKMDAKMDFDFILQPHYC